MSGGGDNSSFDVEFLCDEMFDFETINGAIFILIFIFSLTGNILLVCVLFSFENLRNATNLFILNLACSDLVFTITLPFWAVYHLHHWVFGDFFCKFLTSAYITGLYSSVILLTAMTVDRFATVVLRWSSSPARRHQCAMVSCAAAWIVSFAASVSDAMKVEVETHWNVSTCEFPSGGSDVNLGYYLQVSLLFFLPFATIVFCYSAILKTVLQASNRKSHQTVVVVLCIVVAFFICWGPYHTLLLVQSLYEPIGCYERDNLYIAYSICRILAFSYCCINPLLFMLSQNLRKHLFKLLHIKNGRRKTRGRGTGQITSVI